MVFHIPFAITILISVSSISLTNSCSFTDCILTIPQDSVLDFFSISTISIFILFLLKAMLITPKYQQNNDNHSAYLIGCCRDLMRQYNMRPSKKLLLFLISLNLNLHSRSFCTYQRTKQILYRTLSMNAPVLNPFLNCILMSYLVIHLPYSFSVD